MTNINCYFIATPLSEDTFLEPRAITALNHSKFIVGESKKRSFQLLKRNNIDLEDKELFFLDNAKADLFEELEELIKESSEKELCLFSDAGLPCLFDPGVEVIKLCRKLKYNFRVIAQATSWGITSALSTWQPPFLLFGFLNRKTDVRSEQLNKIKANLKKEKNHVILLETPYRFLTLIDQLIDSFGEHQECFLAWEIQSDDESYLWGSLRKIKSWSTKNQKKKGEFVIILK